MYCKRTAVKNFRNIKEADVSFSDGVNILVGENAQGKTNLLEAIFLASVGRSFRASNSAEMIMFGQKSATVSLDYLCEGRSRDDNITLTLFTDKKKIVEKNHLKLEKMSDIVGSFRAVLFCPEHLSMIKDGPAERRNYLDIAISRISPKYIHSLQRYTYFLKQRNSLIKSAYANRAAFDATVELWSEKMAEEKEDRRENETDTAPTEDGYVTGGRAIQAITVIGQIEGHYILGDNQKATKYEHIIPLLISMEEDEEVRGILIVLNTMGGDVEAGLALAEMIASMKKPTVSLVLGGGHSIGVPLAVSAKRSFIVPSATMTLHPVRISGVVIGAPQTYRYMREMQDRIVGFICRNSRVDRAELEALMMRPDELSTDIGSIIDGNEAVRLGLIDEVGGLGAAMDALREMMQQQR